LATLLKLEGKISFRMQVVEAPLVGIASRDVRKRLAEGRSVRYMIPRGVEAYIAHKGLYRRRDSSEGAWDQLD
jgi:nicotinate-nucleotide adenylyltransferase